MQTQFLIDFIQTAGGAASEYQLMQFVEKKHPQFFRHLGPAPSLFKKHFYLFHELFRLKERMVGGEQSLMISSVGINIYPNSGPTARNLAEPDGLQEFYLNRDNLYLSDEEVSNMLANFWQKYYAIDKKAQAILSMGLENIGNLDLSMIKNRFNQLAHKYHPDKGGNEKYFYELKQAYDVLKYFF